MALLPDEYQSHGSRCAFTGMVHLRPLPGSPGWAGSMKEVLEAARRDAERLVEGGCDLLLVENMGDLPYLRGAVPPETTAAMARATAQVVALGLPVGVQVLAAANREALGVAVAAGAQFLRVEAFAYGHLADEGWLDASAGTLLRARRALCGTGGPRIWADVRKKHAAHAVTADLSLADLAKGHLFNGADALIATGVSTGRPTDAADVVEIAAAGLPVAVGSGVTPDQVAHLAPHCQALIVGSWIKEEGDWRRPVDLERVRAMRRALDEANR